MLRRPLLALFSTSQLNFISRCSMTAKRSRKNAYLPLGLPYWISLNLSGHTGCAVLVSSPPAYVSTPHTSDCWLDMFSLKCSESGPLCPPSVLLSLFELEPIRSVLVLLTTNQMECLAAYHTRTAHGAAGGCVCWVAAACGESVLDILYALGLVRVREPVLAHEEVVAESD
jgi:hypothetical protein